jgi:hypothetical protein
MTKLELLGCLLGYFLAVSPAIAYQSPEQIVKLLQDQSPAGLSGHATVITAGKSIIANISVSLSTTDAELQKFAAELASRILVTGSQTPEQLVVVYEGSAVDRIKSVSISRDQWQLIKDKPDPYRTLSVEDGERAFGDFKPAPVATTAEASTNPYANLPTDDIPITPMPSAAPAALTNQRTKILERLELLRKKGVGTQPYLAILSESEDAFKKGNVEAGKECLDRLDNSLKEQEKQLSSRSTIRLKTGVTQSVSLPAPPTTAPPVAVSGATAPGGATRPGMIDLKSGHPEQDMFAAFLGNHSITEVKGTESQAAETIAKAVLGKALGVDCPNDGPFLLERVRIGTRIHELDLKKMNVSSFRLYFHDNIEALILSKDPRTLKQIADNIKYLERQLGLDALDKSKR